MNSDNIQQKIDSGSGVIVLPPGEYKGPFYISHPCVIEGDSTTLWNSGESVLIISSEGVTLNNLRIEMLDSGNGNFSVCTSHPVITKNVEIIGLTAGFGEEDSCPDFSKQFKLGRFSPEETNTFIFEMYSPGYSEIETDMPDIKLEPVKLSPGINRIKLSTGKLPAGTFLYGDILIKSVFNRRFYIQGTASEKTQRVSDLLISSVNQEEINRLKNETGNYPEIIKKLTSVKQTVKSEPVKTVYETAENGIKRTDDSSKGNAVHTLTRGERISIENYKNRPFRVYMNFKALFSKIDIDPYAFMLNEKGITSCDDDFVFFGNRDTVSGALAFMDDKSIKVDLSSVPEHIKRISFVYSIYQPGPNDNFSKVMDPFVSVVQDDREIVRYTASELFAETTIIFMEIYRHSSGWKLNTIGQGYREGLKRLCAGYGLIVS